MRELELQKPVQMRRAQNSKKTDIENAGPEPKPLRSTAANVSNVSALGQLRRHLMSLGQVWM